MLHKFCECDIAACIWEEIVDWYNSFAGSFGSRITYLSDVQILLRDPKFDPILTRISIFKKSKKEKVTLTQINQFIQVLGVLYDGVGVKEDKKIFYMIVFWLKWPNTIFIQSFE